MSQHDLNIANQGFPAFRADLNDALGALVSNSSGATAPTATFAHQFWVDTSVSPNILRQRNADNDAWIVIGSIDQVNDRFVFLGSSSDSASLPSFSFNGDPNTGMFTPGSDQVAFTTGGTARLTVTTEQFTGTLPWRGQNGTAAAPAISASGDTNTGIYFPAADTLGFVEGGSEVMRITSAGNVGIGTSSPDARLHVANNQGGSTGRVLIDANVSSGYDAKIISTDVGLEFTAQSNSRGFAFSTGSTPTERMRITHDGDLQFNSGYGSVATAYACRAWVNFNGTGTVAIRASGNVSSITDNGTGDYTVNFTTAMPDANYSVGGTSSFNGNYTALQWVSPQVKSTTNVRVYASGSTSGLNDMLGVDIQVFR